MWLVCFWLTMKLGSPYWGYIRLYGLLLHLLNLRTVVWLCFAIVRESSKCLARLREICMWLNGFFTSAAATVLFVIRCPSSPSSASAVSFTVVVHHPPSPSVACRRSPRRPLLSESSAIVVCRRHSLCYVPVLYPEGWRYRQSSASAR